MQFLIPDVPRELKTQMQREQLLAKEAKYQHGLNKAEDEYGDLLLAIRENNNTNVNSNNSNNNPHSSNSFPRIHSRSKLMTPKRNPIIIKIL